jgi:hypothetical protein
MGDPIDDAQNSTWVDPFERALSAYGRDFQQIARETQTSVATRSGLLSAANAINRPGLTLEQRASALARAGYSQIGSLEDIKKALEGGQAPSIVMALTSQANSLQTAIDKNLDRMTGLNPQGTFELFPDAAADSGRIKLGREILGIQGGGSGQSYAPAAQQIVTAPNGSLYSYNPNNGAITKVGDFPDFHPTQVVKDERTGDAFAVDQVTGERKNLGNYGFAAIDPKVQFTETQRVNDATLAVQRMNVDANFKGVELQRRGQQVAALGEDWSRQIQLGQLTLQEVQTNLNRISTAFEVEQKQREQQLQYAVKRSSLSEVNGETVTTLPFADQIAGILSASTGQDYSRSDFQLATTVVDPQAAGQKVLDATNFESSIPSLKAGAASTTAAQQAIVNAALPTTTVPAK